MSGIAQMFLGGGAANVLGSYIKTDSAQATSGAVAVTRSATTSTDLLIAFMGDQDPATWAQPAGWTERADQGAVPSFGFATKASGGADTSSVFTPTPSTKQCGAAVLTFRGATYDTISTIATSSGVGALTPAAITVAANNSMLLMICMSENASRTFTTPTGMNALVSYNGGTGVAWAVFWQAVNAGSTGASRTSTSSGGGSNAAVLTALTLS